MLRAVAQEARSCVAHGRLKVTRKPLPASSLPPPFFLVVTETHGAAGLEKPLQSGLEMEKAVVSRPSSLFSDS